MKRKHWQNTNKIAPCEYEIEKMRTDICSRVVETQKKDRGEGPATEKIQRKIGHSKIENKLKMDELYEEGVQKVKGDGIEKRDPWVINPFLGGSSSFMAAR